MGKIEQEEELSRANCVLPQKVGDGNRWHRTTSIHSAELGGWLDGWLSVGMCVWKDYFAQQAPYVMAQGEEMSEDERFNHFY